MIDRSEEPIWAPCKQKIDSSNIKNFSKYLSKCDLGDYNDYDELWDWSVNNIESFWSAFWDYSNVVGPVNAERGSSRNFGNRNVDRA